MKKVKTITETKEFISVSFLNPTIDDLINEVEERQEEYKHYFERKDSINNSLTRHIILFSKKTDDK